MQMPSRKWNLITKISYVLIAFFWSIPICVAQTVDLENPIGTDEIPVLAGNIIKAVLGFTGSVALLIFIYGGFIWLTSTGNPDKIKKGQGTLIWAAIGLAFIFSSYMIASFIIKALGG